MGVMNKPEVMSKMRQFIRKVKKNGNKVGRIPRSIAIDYNNICNFKCEFCYEREDMAHNGVSLDFETIARVADEAYELGVWEIVLQGGELLVDRESLFKILEALKPERFQVILVTNGYLLTPELAETLAERGVDCVAVSLSGMDAEAFDRSRGVKGAHQRALQALENARNAGLATWIQPIFGHHNSKSQDLFDLLEYAKANDYATYFLLAMPYGVWKDNVLDAEDLEIFNRIRKTYKSYFDTWDFYDPKKEGISGCWAMNRLFITPKGDALPCPFINLKVGNVKEQSLKSIFDYGFSIKYFGEYSPVCLAAQNKAFRKQYLSGSTSMFSPVEAKAVFIETDYTAPDTEV